MNGEFLRGEVYWIRFGDAVGSEETGGRPGLIISGSKANVTNPTVIVCFLSTQSNDLSIYPTIMINGKRSRVLCNQIQTVDKARIERHIYTLTEPEMIRVGGALAIAMCIPQTTGKPQPVVEKPVDEKQDDEKQANEIASLRCESDMWRRMYEKVMGQLVEIRVSTAISQKMAIAQPKVVDAPVVAAVVETPVVVTEEPPVEEQVEERAEERVDINHCTQTALRKIGFSLPMCRLIVSYRPFESVSDLKRVPGMKASFFRIVEPKLCCTPMAVAPEKVVVVKDDPDPGYEVENKRVNVNTATVDEMVAAGIYRTMAQLIRAYRNKNGQFSSVEDLLNVPRCNPIFLNRHRDMLEV